MKNNFWSRVLDRVLGFIAVITSVIGGIIGTILCIVIMPIVIVVKGIVDRDWDWRYWMVALCGLKLGISYTFEAICSLAKNGLDYTADIYDPVEDSRKNAEKAIREYFGEDEIYWDDFEDEE